VWIRVYPWSRFFFNHGWTRMDTDSAPGIIRAIRGTGRYASAFHSAGLGGTQDIPRRPLRVGVI
jgi:hypothetical protein